MRLTLIPFAPQSRSEEVQKTIVGIGYSVDILRSEQWLRHRVSRSRDPSVLLLGGDELPFDRLRSALLSESQVPTFAIVFNDYIEKESEILRLCTDFSSWPCHEHELACRLRRLSDSGGQTYAPLDHNGIVNEFVALKMIGRSPSFLKVLSLIKKIARCDAPVLIEGETGTGKEVAARAIHYIGKRRDYPFIPVNCGALPDNLIENELFGHDKGAYTDAKHEQPGLVEQANGGTLFLDEVETLSYKGQVTLLRFLQDQNYRPLGGKKTRQVNVRIIAASNTSLPELVAQGKYRQDLLFRLNIMTVNLPPLRERSGDVASLAQHFIQQYGEQYHETDKQLHPETIAWMNNYSWPGNVRELENFIHREFLLADNWVIRSETDTGYQRSDRRKHLDRRQELNFDTSFNKAKSYVINEFEKRYLHWLMENADGNVTHAAKIAGKERRALGKLIKKHNIVKITKLDH